MPKKLKIAVTGGIGSGKSTVCEILRSKDFPIIYADDVSKEILSSNSSIQKKIISEFGDESFIDNNPNVKFLSEKVFTDSEKVKKINSILHPPTIEKIVKEMNIELKEQNLVFVEAALIYEAKMESLFDYVLVVTSPEELRIDRAMTTRNLKRDEVLERIAKQMPEDKKRKLADFVIENIGTKEELKSKVEFVLLIINSLIK